MAVKEYLRKRFFPQIWCPGCGHGIVMTNMIRAIEQVDLEKNEVVVVSGIGCSSRMPGYLDFHTLHTLHGRALAFATGVKLGKPWLTVIVPMGDGDALAIGGNHFIHAARRNVDLTAIIMNNNIYGMTGGQYSPLTPLGGKATTATAGTIDGAFDVVQLAMGAGASFVARTTTYHAKEMIKIISQAIKHKGFAVVEVMSQCPTYYGRKNKLGSAVDMLNRFKEDTVPIGSKKKEENPDLLERGIFVQEERPEYTESYVAFAERCQQEMTSV
ncbi:MAG: 2-oxoacid:ferredoxin oxidoreductase subunit beta [Deltaproteobacteria bacterium]|nr:2-oxoacid:ferredoxin oxidoreductase subunit beta [Deltaproteobacteria bacterium]MBW2072638.1 2-oxoacid:ferredoxin oxidoreductase subunit beta [Deltaproteobacteria bacterium]